MDATADVLRSFWKQPPQTGDDDRPAASAGKVRRGRTVRSKDLPSR